MIDIYPIKPELSTPNIQRHKKYLIIWCKVGCLSIHVDGKDFKVRSGQLITITSGQAFRIANVGESEGVVLEFTYDFFCKDDRDLELIFHNGLFCHFALNEVVAVPETHGLSEHFNLMRDEFVARPYQYLISLHSRLSLVLTEINRAKIDQGHEIWRPDALFLKFLELVIANFGRNYTVKEFAGLLATTESQLNQLAKQHTGKTAQNVIFGLIISESQRRLLYSDLSVKEIAYQLGFQDPFYFSRFFKRHVSKSPIEYRQTTLHK